MADDRITRIYVLRDPRDGAVRYVGKTTQKLRSRLNSHRSSARKSDTHRDRWVATILALGLAPIIEEIEVVRGEGWAAREAFWIIYYRSIGCRLTNLTSGGEGCAGVVWSDASREKARLARTPAMRATASLWLKKLTSDPEFLAANSERLKLRNSDPEFIAENSTKTRARLQDPEVKAAAIAPIMKYYLDPKNKAAAADRLHKRNADPDFRAASAERLRKLNADPVNHSKRSARGKRRFSDPLTRIAASKARQELLRDNPEMMAATSLD